MATTARSGSILITTVRSDNPPEVLTPRKLTRVKRMTELTPTAMIPEVPHSAGNKLEIADAVAIASAAWAAMFDQKRAQATRNAGAGPNERSI